MPRSVLRVLNSCLALLNEQLPEGRVECVRLLEERRVAALLEDRERRALDRLLEVLAVGEREDHVVAAVEDGGRDGEGLQVRAQVGGEERLEAGRGHVRRGLLHLAGRPRVERRGLARLEAGGREAAGEAAEGVGDRLRGG